MLKIAPVGPAPSVPNLELAPSIVVCQLLALFHERSAMRRTMTNAAQLRQSSFEQFADDVFDDVDGAIDVVSSERSLPGREWVPVVSLRGSP